MAGVTELQNVTKKGNLESQAFPVNADEKIYQGTVAGVATADGLLSDLDATLIAAGVNTAAFIKDGSENNNATAPSIDGSISGDRQEASGLSNGEKTVRQGWTKGNFLITTATSLTQASVGAKLYAIDNFTFSLTSTSNLYVGRIIEYVSATSCWVEWDAQGIGA